jgi:hypothetical protein
MGTVWHARAGRKSSWRVSLAALALCTSALVSCKSSSVVVVSVSRRSNVPDDAAINVEIFSSTKDVATLMPSDSIPVPPPEVFVKRGYRLDRDVSTVQVRLVLVPHPGAQPSFAKTFLWSGETIAWVAGEESDIYATSLGGMGAGGGAGGGGGGAGGGWGGSPADGGVDMIAGSGPGGTGAIAGAAGGGGAFPPGSGGALGSGGLPGGGGGRAGGPGSGGIAATGGASSTGGMTATGGAATGGAVSTGGVVGTGGVVASGGMMASGGTVATGGIVGTGGVVGTGGMTMEPPSGHCITNTSATCDCSDYCTALAAQPCPAVGSFFPNDDCMSVCTGLGWSPQKLSRQAAGTNTAACRIQRAMQGATACGDASPTGGTLCTGGATDPCPVYCDAVTRNCPTAYASRDACLSYCGQQAQSQGWWAANQKLTTSGDTGNCRLFWAAQAGLPGNSAACASAGETSVMCQ